MAKFFSCGLGMVVEAAEEQQVTPSKAVLCRELVFDAFQHLRHLHISLWIMASQLRVLHEGAIPPSRGIGSRGTEKTILFLCMKH